MKKKTLYIYDIDGTILKFVNGHSAVEAPPDYNRIEELNKYYDNGDWIILWTQRPLTNRKRTINHLKKLGIKYHMLLDDKNGEIKIYDDCNINIKFEKVIRVHQ